MIGTARTVESRDLLRVSGFRYAFFEFLDVLGRQLRSVNGESHPVEHSRQTGRRRWESCLRLRPAESQPPPWLPGFPPAREWRKLISEWVWFLRVHCL